MGKVFIALSGVECLVRHGLQMRFDHARSVLCEIIPLLLLSLDLVLVLGNIPLKALNLLLVRRVNGADSLLNMFGFRFGRLDLDSDRSGLEVLETLGPQVLILVDLKIIIHHDFGVFVLFCEGQCFCFNYGWILLRLLLFQLLHQLQLLLTQHTVVSFLARVRVNRFGGFPDVGLCHLPRVLS